MLYTMAADRIAADNAAATPEKLNRPEPRSFILQPRQLIPTGLGQIRVSQCTFDA